MSSHSKRIGDIGQASVIAKLLTFNDIVISRSVSDNEAYDIIIDIGSNLYRVQIKTTEFIKDGCMNFSTSITNPFQKTNRMYDSNEVDLFILYCIENKYFGLMSINEYTSTTTTIRLIPPHNNNYKNVKMFNDYNLDDRLLELIHNGNLSNKLLDKEKAVDYRNSTINADIKSDAQKSSYINQRKVERPSTYDKFKLEMSELGWNYSAMARKYGVSDNTVRKWERYYLKYDI